MSDVTLELDGELVPAHKFVLGAKSRYFHRLLYGQMSESAQNVVTLKDTPADAFKVLLKYFYTEDLILDGFNFDLLVEILRLSHRYQIDRVTEITATKLRDAINGSNIVDVLEVGQLYELAELTSTCINFMKKRTNEIIECSSFLRFNIDFLKKILHLDEVNVREVELFKVAIEWIKENKVDKDIVNSILGLIKMECISIKDLIDIVLPYGYHTEAQILQMIRTRNLPEKVVERRLGSQSNCRSLRIHYDDSETIEVKVMYVMFGRRRCQVKGAVFGDSEIKIAGIQPLENYAPIPLKFNVTMPITEIEKLDVGVVDINSRTVIFVRLIKDSVEKIRNALKIQVEEFDYDDENLRYIAICFLDSNDAVKNLLHEKFKHEHGLHSYSKKTNATKRLQSIDCT